MNSPVTDTGSVTSSLTSITPQQRRRIGLTLLGFSLLLLAAGILPFVSHPGTGWRITGVFVIALALLLALIASGFDRSGRIELNARREALNEAQLDAAIRAAQPNDVCGSTDSGAGCGHACGADCFKTAGATAL